MGFATDKAEQYAYGGVILADIAGDLGSPLWPSDRQRWSETMRRIAVVDDILDDCQDSRLTAGEAYVACLDLPTHGVLVRAADRLLGASAAAKSATDITDHFRSRGEEATACFDLLWYQLDPEQTRNHYVHQQLGSLAALGNYVDSLRDAREDAEDLHFSPAQLVRGALAAIAGEIPAVDRRTWISALRAGRRYELTDYIGKKLLFTALNRHNPTTVPA